MWNLKSDVWTNSDPEKHQSAFKEYTVIRQQPEGPGVFKIAVRELAKEDGDLIIAVIDGVSGKSPPLGSARNLDLIIKDNSVVGINLMGDCVVKK